MATPLSPEEFLADEWTWLLEVRWAGRAFRWSVEPVEAVDGDGARWTYAGGLEVSFGASFDLFRESPGHVSLPFDLVFPVDVAALVQAGHDLAAATGELSMWAPGRLWEQRRVVLEGRLTAPEYGAAGEPVSFSLEENPFEDRALIPDARARVTLATWVHHDADVRGRYYPLVFGAPGVFTEPHGRLGKTSGSPGLLVDTRLFNKGGTSYLLIAGHRVAASHVRVVDYDADDGEGAAATFAVEHVPDGLGRTVAVVRIGSPGSTVPVKVAAGHEYWVRWEGDEDPAETAGLVGDGAQPGSAASVSRVAPVPIDELGSGSSGSGGGQLGLEDLLPDEDNEEPVETMFTGGASSVEPITDGALLNRRRDGALFGAGELLRYMLALSTLRLDTGRFAAIEPFLNRFQVSGFLEEPVSPWEWLEDQLIPLLPISMATGPGGLYPILWRADAGESDAVAELVAGPDLQRDGPVSYPSKDVVNEIRLDYAVRADSGDFMRSATVTGEDVGTFDRFTTVYSRVSRRRYGKKEEAMETEIVYDTATAKLILSWQVRARGFPWRELSYEADPRRWGWLTRGTVVTLTDLDLHFERQVALVRDRSWDGHHLELTFLLLDDPVRDRRHEARVGPDWIPAARRAASE
ncbi:MAG: hypothetical protein GY719_13340 [bacterium]|nr:hypothetical protein [bacterium]